MPGTGLSHPWGGSGVPAPHCILISAPRRAGDRSALTWVVPVPERSFQVQRLQALRTVSRLGLEWVRGAAPGVFTGLAPWQRQLPSHWAECDGSDKSISMKPPTPLRSTSPSLSGYALGRADFDHFLGRDAERSLRLSEKPPYSKYSSRNKSHDNVYFLGGLEGRKASGSLLTMWNGSSLSDTGSSPINRSGAASMPSSPKQARKISIQDNLTLQPKLSRHRDPASENTGGLPSMGSHRVGHE